MSSIKDKITPGEWYSNSHYVRTSNERTYSIGHAYVDKSDALAEGEANAKLWATSKSMLDILERLAVFHESKTANSLIVRFAKEANNLLKQLNNE